MRSDDGMQQWPGKHGALITRWVRLGALTATSRGTCVHARVALPAGYGPAMAAA